MKTIVRWSMLLGAAFFIATATAQPASQKQLVWYADNVSSDAVGWEGMLREALRSQEDPNVAISVFARQLNVPIERASEYARLIIRAARFDSQCDDITYFLTCHFQRGSALYDDAERLGLSEPTGELLAIVGRAISDDDVQQHAFFALARRHTASDRVFAPIYDHARYPLMLVGMLASGHNLDHAALLIAQAELSSEPDAASWGLAFTGEAARASQPARVQAALAQVSIRAKLAWGMSREAISEFESLAPGVRSLVPLYSDACGSKYSCSQLAGSGYDVIDGLLAAYWTHARRPPKDWLLRIGGVLPPVRMQGLPPREDTLGRRDALAEAIRPRIQDAELFELFVQGPANAKAGGPIADTSWMSSTMFASPVIKHAVARRFAEAGYSDIARDLRIERETYAEMFFDKQTVQASRYARFFPAGLRLDQISWMVRLHAVNLMATIERRVGEVTGEKPSVHVSTDGQTPAWREVRLPPGTKAWDGRVEYGQFEEPQIPADARLPISAFGVLRYGREAGEQQIIYQSTDYDQPGEVPAFGLWYQATRKGEWQKPLYLGLQQYFPYVVTPASGLPLLAGDKLQIEVRVQEIDPDTITFPPVGLGYRRQDRGLLIELPLATLRSDADDDGLTDIEERRIGLDPANRDTDGDGMPDGWDPLPLTPVIRQQEPWKQALAMQILEKIIGHEREAIMIQPADGPLTLDDMLAASAKPVPAVKIDTVMLVGQADLFAGLAVPYRLLVYSVADVAALARDGAPNMPPGIETLYSSLDRRTHYVAWSASWVGGTFIVRCDANWTCVTKSISEWIT